MKTPCIPDTLCRDLRSELFSAPENIACVQKLSRSCWWRARIGHGNGKFSHQPHSLMFVRSFGICMAKTPGAWPWLNTRDVVFLSLHFYHSPGLGIGVSENKKPQLHCSILHTFARNHPKTCTDLWGLLRSASPIYATWAKLRLASREIINFNEWPEGTVPQARDPKYVATILCPDTETRL
jgi:hypothetical protein